MARMNVVIDRELLERARKITGKKNYSETINHALGEIERVHAVKSTLDLMAGTDWWEGDLDAMRRDRIPAKAASRVAAKTARQPKRKTAVRRRSN
jgi:hypothetical protein